jgi:hypothetical protein
MIPKARTTTIKEDFQANPKLFIFAVVTIIVFEIALFFALF